MRIARTGVVLLGAAISLAGCSRLPGKPGFRPETLRPDQTHDFATLYKSNCAGCHGDRGKNGAAMPLDNPVYLAWAGREHVRTIVESGVPHSLMPGFSAGAGGLLTGQQVKDIVNGMMSEWGRPDAPGTNAPGYTAAAAGDAAAGQAAYGTFCARCHGADGQGVRDGKQPGAVAGSIVDPTYLSLITDRGLRDIVVAGMPAEGMPDWRGDAPGRAMTDSQVTDVVAWLASKRVEFPGQPFPRPVAAGQPQGSGR